MKKSKEVEEHVEYALTSSLFGMFESKVHGSLLISCGHWDFSFKVTKLDTGKVIQSIAQHGDVVTSLSLVEEFGQYWLLTASRDCTVMVWEVSSLTSSNPIQSVPYHVLQGHDDAVIAIWCDPVLDLVASGSVDGTIILHSLRDGGYIRTISHITRSEKVRPVSQNYFTSSSSSSSSSRSSINSSSVKRRGSGGISSSKRESGGYSLPGTTNTITPHIHWVGISKAGFIISYSHNDQILCSYSINGTLLARKHTNEALYAFCFSLDGETLVTGGNLKEIRIRWCRTLTPASNGDRAGLQSAFNGTAPEIDIPPFPSPIRSLALTKDERHLLVGLESGEMRIVVQDSDYLRQRLKRRLVAIGIM